MQRLLVDLGNTRLKWAMQIDGVLQTASRFTHRDQDLLPLLAQAWNSLANPQQVVVASVANHKRREQLADWVQQYWSLNVDFVSSPGQGHGLTNSYAEPAKLGCDRWAAMVAAYHAAHTAVCVVDCGSAVTLDAVDAGGQHLGGLIVPGIQAMSEALTGNTTLVPVDFTHIPESLLGTSTQEGMARGISYAISSLIQQLLSELEQTRGVRAACYLTGGDSPVIARLLQIPYVLDADLVLHGLAIMADAT
jgi:type III pantothenate kinase